MRISYNKDFTKKFIRHPKKIKDKFKERLILFEKNEFNPILNNHALTGKYKGYRSINVSGDVRAVFRRGKDDALFVKIDSHSNLYG